MRGVILSTVIVVAAGLGLGGGYLWGSLRAPPPAAAAVSAHRGEPGDVGAHDARAGGGPSEPELRRVVREELAASARAASPGQPGQPGRPGRGDGSAGEPVAVAPSATPAVFDDSLRHVHQAIAQRQWTPADAAALSRTLDTASPAQRAELLHTLIPALNRGDVKLTYRGSVF